MKLTFLHEDYWTPIPKSNKKGKYSFLVGGIKDRNRFMKKMHISGKKK